MLVVVKRGYISQGSKLCGKGTALELDDATAARLLESGQVEAAGYINPQPVADLKSKAPVKKSTTKKVEATPAVALPEVDPATAVAPAANK